MDGSMIWWDFGCGSTRCSWISRQAIRIQVQAFSGAVTAPINGVSSVSWRT
jgi:hypothetical protein